MYLPAPDESLHVGVLRLVLRLPASRSLKDRRRVVLALRDRIRARHQAAVAEVGHLDNPAAAVLAVAVVGNDARGLRARLDTIRAEADALPDALLAEHQVEIRGLDERL